ncbi:hypothetical protein [Clostridium perfringens]|uniref:hypothetical protein n=1 Tax=Clostridium perfringens TaxID=1502 RepID=UPI0022458BAB|nr:hypothetical protein [Clostridium perfringens]EJT5920852.1 hypothetical protein [Clostridium perfringens]EJT5920962.1 hypothetical protein [Clostridium perfringens]MCX0403359.1 hypothetical protein [Clostridium perfringens]MDM0947499.1 hypothetical protein [Clostridium perfringens]
MSFIDYAKIYKVEFDITDMSLLMEIIDPTNYSRFFKEIIKESNLSDKKDNNKNKREKDIYQKHQEAIEQLKLERDRTKNITSLSLIYRAFKTTRFDRNKNVCMVTLNTMLCYELYVSLSCSINRIYSKLNKIESKMENIEPLSTQSDELNTEYAELHKEYEKLKEINDKVIKGMRVEMIYELAIAYDKLSPEQHMQKCLI